MADVTQTPTPAPTPVVAPEPSVHHFNLLKFLEILLTVAPAVVSPFVKNPSSQAVFGTEVGISKALLESILGAKG